MSEIQSRVVAIIANKLGVAAKAITFDTHLVDDLGADSLDCLELIMELEEAFDMPATPSEVMKEIQTVGQIVTHIAQHTKGSVAHHVDAPHKA